MERTMSVEEKIRRAEEIYNRRKENEFRNTTARVNVENKKNTSALKKIRNQVIVCVLIYLVFYYLINNNSVFSEEFKNKVNGILTYEISFSEIYNNISNYIKNLINENEKENIEPTVDSGITQNENNNYQEENANTTNDNQETSEGNQNSDGQNDENESQDVSLQNNIGGADVQEIETTEDVEKELTEEEQMQIDAQEIKNSISVIVPVQGTITSAFGVRDSNNSIVSKYHTGLDIGAITGTDIISATDGKVTLKSSTGSYGNHLKIEINDISFIYAHCSKLLVNEGDEIKQGQKIAEVGSTGNSTGPHLHFEIRKSGRYVNPQLVLNF